MRAVCACVTRLAPPSVADACLVSGLVRRLPPISNAPRPLATSPTPSLDLWALRSAAAIMSAGSSSRIAIDLTALSSDEDQVPRRGFAPTEGDDSIQFVSEVRKGKAKAVEEDGDDDDELPSLFSPSQAYRSPAKSSASQRRRSAGRTGVDASPSSSAIRDMLADEDVVMGDETRQLLTEMVEDSRSTSSMDDDEAPLALLSLASPARSPAKRPRGRPRKLALASSPGNNNDDDDDGRDGDEDEDDAEGEGEDDAEAEPDSLYVSAALSRALAEAVRADTQLWDRILRFEPIPLEELASCATKAATAYAREASSGGSGTSSSLSNSGTVGRSRAWAEWDTLVAGAQKRLELAVQAWADEQGICSYAGEGRNEKRKARSKAARVQSPSAAAGRDEEDGYGSQGSSPSKRRRAGKGTISAKTKKKTNS